MENCLGQFLRRTETAGPLQIVILESLGEGLHRRTVNDLMRSKVLSEF